MESRNFKYYAFISYSHKDKVIAKKLQRKLERYHLPSKLRKDNPGLPKKLEPIFLDESNLVAKGSLKTALQENLERSNYLIVVCSPSSARSEYVNDEVDYFIKLGRSGHIIPLIVEGVPYSGDEGSECFPPALRALPRELEPLGIDLKKFGVRNAFLRVIATLLELDLDSFISRVVVERIKRAVMWAVLAIVVGAGVWYERDFIIGSSLDASAQYNMGQMYYFGRGVERDYVKAMEWYLRAAEKGHADAQYNIGCMYSNGLGVERDYVKAMEWYLKAAEKSDADAQNNIGYMYHHGLGVERDYAKAMEWYLRAAEKGNAVAQNNIGYMYHYGHGVERDYAKAMEWYLKAAENGNSSAQNHIGELYENGLGVEQNLPEALKWYQQAANNGHSQARNNLERLQQKLNTQE